MTPTLPITCRSGTSRLPVRASRLALRVLQGRWKTLAIILLTITVHLTAQQNRPTKVQTFVADFNHDGIPDVLAASPLSKNLILSFGSVPYGTFNPNPSVISVDCGFGSGAADAFISGQLAVADFNGDSIPDIFSACYSNSGMTTSGVRLGNGDGTFATMTTLNAPYAQGGVTGDFNHDGKLDLVLVTYPNGLTATGYQTPSLLFFAGNGDGTFASPVASPLGSSATFQTGNYLLDSPVATDVDGDGYPDILLNAAYGYTSTSTSGATLVIAVFGNRKDGTFGILSQGTRTPDATARVGAGSDANPLKLIPGHFASLTSFDFVVPDTGTSPGIVFIANTSTPGTFTLTPGTRSPFANLKAATPATFTGSGYTDLAVATSTSISALVNDGTATFTPSYTTLSFPVSVSDAFNPSTFTATDANGDGYSDIYTASIFNSRLSIAVNFVTGSATATTAPFSLPRGSAALTATWPGNTSLSGSTATGTQTVTGVSTTTSIASSKNPSTTGDAVTFTAVVSPAISATSTPTGSVDFTEGATTLGTGIVDDSGTATFTITTLSATNHSLHAVYRGDSIFEPSNSTLLTQVVNQPPAVSPTLSWSPPPVNVGTALSTTQLNAVATNAAGTAIPGTYVYTPIAGTILSAVGSQVLSVTFTPSDLVAYKPASLSVPISVLPTTQTPLTNNLLLNPGAELGLVSGAIPNWTPAGDGSPSLDSGSFDGGINPHTGAYDFLGTNGAADSLSQTVSLLTQGITSTLIDSGTVSASLSFWEQGLSQGNPSDDASVTLTFLDSASRTLSSITTGEADFHDGTWQNLTGSYPIPSGTRSIIYTMNFIRHSGSDLDAFVDDNSLILTTAPAAVPTTTTLALTSGTNPITTVAQGTPVTLTATVLADTTAIAPGQVNFCDAAFRSCTDIHLLGTAQLTPTGIATLKFIPSPGAHTYRAVFLGTTSYATSTSTASSLAVTAAYATTTSLALTGTTGSYTLTTTVVGPSVQSPPTGLVSFVDQSRNNAVLTQASLGASTLALSLAPGSTTATGTEPAAAARADFNGDGRPDLIIVNTPRTIGAAANKPTILLTNLDGTFTSTQGPDLLNGSVVTADFNGDGKADFAGPASSGSGISVFLGNGDGTFASALSTATSASAGNLVAADLNSDGIADLAVLSFDSQSAATSLTVLLGKGDGTFTTGTTTVLPGTGSYDITSADLNADGKPDLILTGAYQSSSTGPAIYLASILLGNGDGTFTTQPSITSTNSMQTTLAADFNGDGKTDLVFTSPAQDGSVILNVFLGMGDGTFTTQDPATLPSTTGAYLTSTAVADFNADGIPDIAIATYPRIALLLNDGHAIFTRAASIARGDSTPDYLPIVVGDFNGDGIPDVFTTDSDNLQATLTLTQASASATAAASNISPFGNGAHQVVASYPGSTLYAASTSAPVTLAGQSVTPNLIWTPVIATLPYGTPLGVQQLNATATTPTGQPLPGTYTYNPALGAVLSAGTQTLAVTFTATDTIYAPISATQAVTITRATPILAWATPSPISQGTALSEAQLNASALGITGATLPGTFTYAPAAGAVPAAGTQTLSATFTPDDLLNYTTATAAVRLTVTGLTLTSITPTTASLGDTAKTITLSGAGFTTASTVQVNGTSIPTAFVNATTLTAIVPATNFTTVGILTVAVVSPATSSRSQALPFTILAPAPSVTLTGPGTTQPGTQPTLALAITNPYPVPLTATFTLAFASNVTPIVDDPAIQFANGGRTFTFTVAANTTTVPSVQLQAGTIAGTITIPLALTAAGVNVTPATLQPVTIIVPAAIPAVTTASITRGTGTFTVTVHGFSNTREVATAAFHFLPAIGAQIDTPDVTIPVSTIFSGWFTSAPSVPYGSTFTYTQVFNVSDSAANIGSVQVTLTNSVGVSTTYTAQ